MPVNHKLSLYSYIVEEDMGCLRIFLWDRCVTNKEHRVRMSKEMALELKDLLKYYLKQDQKELAKQGYKPDPWNMDLLRNVRNSATTK